MEKTLTLSNISSWLFGFVVIAIGLINTFWGNDPVYGIFLLLLSIVYFPPAAALFRHVTGRPMPPAVRVLLGIFILWTAVGVGELSNKTDLMLLDLYTE